MSAAVDQNLANNSGGNSENNNIQNGNSELAQLVKESTVSISNQKMEPPRRGPGRPPKNRPAEPAAATSKPTEPQAEPVPPPDISQFMVPALQGISNLPASKYQIPELALTEPEAKAIADSLQNVLNAFVPDLSKMSPKTAAILGAAITCGSIGVAKMHIYAAVQEARLAEIRKQKTVEAETNPPVTEYVAPKPAPNFAQNNPFNG